MWCFRPRCSVVAVPQTRWTLGLWCRLLGPKVSKKWDKRNKERLFQGREYCESSFLNHFSLIFFLQIYLSRYAIHTSIPKDVHLVSMPSATYTCPILSYDAFYSIAGVWVGSVAAISMLAARSRQRRWPAILKLTVWALIFWWIYSSQLESLGHLPAAHPSFQISRLHATLVWYLMCDLWCPVGGVIDLSVRDTKATRNQRPKSSMPLAATWSATLRC